MNQHDPYDARLAQAVDDLADARVPAYTAEVLARTRRSRQRPAWTFLQRWFPMTTIAQRAPVARPLVLIPRGLLILIALGLLTALAVAGLVAGARLTSTQAVLPAPVTGPAANGLIAFQRGGDIYVVEPDGSHERPLIVAPGRQEVPVWSRDGTRIAYWSQPTDSGPWDLMVARADGSGATTVASGLIDQMDHHPAVVGANWSPDGDSLVFSARTVPHREAACEGETEEGGYCSSRIFIAAADGSTEPVAVGDPDLDARKPTFSPDGWLIAFGGGDGRSSQDNRLYVMNTDGTDVRQISRSSGLAWSFARHDWSPDGSHIASQVGGSYTDIVLVAADGSGESMITDTPFSDEDAPSFAADGSLSWRGGSAMPCCVAVQAADGARTDLSGTLSIWSPDASFLVTGGAPLTDSDPKVVVDRAGTVLATIPEAATPSWQRLAPSDASLLETSTPIALPTGKLDPGTYYIDNPYLGCERGCADYSRLTFTVPDGWSAGDGLVAKHLGQPGEVAFSVWTVDRVYEDACQWERSSLHPLDLGGHSHDESGAFIFPEGYENALVGQRGRVASAPTELTQDDRNVLRIELAIPSELDLATCDGGEFRSWTGVAGDVNAHHAPGQVDVVYMVDVDRRPLVIDASYQPATTEQDLAELEEVLASMLWGYG